MSVIKNLIRSYGDSAGDSAGDFKIDIPEWNLADSGITALSGPSGSGKSSVIRLLLGLDSCPTLMWQFNGENLAALPIEQRRLGVVFQSYELFPHLTGRENIQFAARARKIEINRAQNRMAKIVANLSLVDCLDRPARVLSGGERQRVALARALIGEPRFLFLDEPFAALDADLRTEARALVKNVIDEFQIPTLLVSHDEADIRALAKYVVKIRNGRIDVEK